MKDEDKFTRYNFNVQREKIGQQRVFVFCFFVLAVVIGIFCIILMKRHETRSFDLCTEWGGTLYEDNHCYPLNDMGRCVDAQGQLGSGLAVNMNLSAWGLDQ